MKYYLIILNDIGDYEIVENFSKIPGFEMINEHSLQGITTFTSEFLDKEALTTFLIENNLFPLSQEQMKKQFKDFNYRILFQKKDKVAKILEFGISYSPASYLFNIKNLLNFYLSHLNDSNFMRLFCNRFYTTLGSTAKFRPSLEYIKNNVFIHNENREKKEKRQERMEFFIKAYLGLESENEINYLRLRELVMFALYYQENYEFDREKRPINPADEAEISHYEKLLCDSALSREETNSYLAKINELKRKNNGVKQ